jgi:hypothetical protein
MKPTKPIRSFLSALQFSTTPLLQSKSVRPSPTQSNRIQPNPTTPPPPGKQIGKERIKFLAIFDHLDGARPTRFRLALPIRRVTILE